MALILLMCTLLKTMVVAEDTHVPCVLLGQATGSMSPTCCTYFNSNIPMLMAVLGGDMEAMVTQETCGTCRAAVSAMIGFMGLGEQELVDAETQFDDRCARGSGEEEGGEEAASTDDVTDDDEEGDGVVELGANIECTVVIYNVGQLPEKCCTAATNFILGLSALEELTPEGTFNAIKDALQKGPLMCDDCMEVLMTPIDFLATVWFGRAMTYSEYLAVEADEGKVKSLAIYCGLANPRELQPVGSCDQELIDMVQVYRIGGIRLKSRGPADWWPAFVYAGFCDPETGKVPTDVNQQWEYSYIHAVFATW